MFGPVLRICQNMIASQGAIKAAFCPMFERSRTHMKMKISITLSAAVLAEIDHLAGFKHSRSAVIEGVLEDYLRERARAGAEARDLELIQ